MLIDFTTMKATATSADAYETQTVYAFLEFIEKYRLYFTNAQVSDIIEL